jgi:hypothetical protein
VTSLYVAAGGGGDALAAAIVHRALGHDDPAVIATYAWDRLAVDPLPGPRSATEFTGLRTLGSHNHVITSTTAPLPPSGSTLPRLAGDLGDTLVLLDPAHGATGMGTQLTELVDIYRPTVVTVLDVGGDVIARGDEPGLRSPLADALSLAAVTDLDTTVDVMVAGPGLDGELREADVLDITGHRTLVRLSAADVEPFKATLDWHPSEATALLAAAARGIRGHVEIRDAGLIVDLTENSPEVYALPLAAVLDHNSLAAALADTRRLTQAEQVTRDQCGFTEIDHERAKRRRRESPRDQLGGFDLDSAVQDFERAALARKVDYVTFRRIAEAISPAPVNAADIRRHLIATRPSRYEWPLWSLATHAATRSAGRPQAV